MPVLLYNGRHPVHVEIANAIDATLIPSEKGSVLDRFRSAATSEYNDTVIIEGGQPLVETAFLKQLGNVDRVVLFAADETQINVFDPQPWYSKAERIAHRFAHRYVDAAICVSEDIKEYTKRLVDGPVYTAEPFITRDVYESLGEIEPDLESKQILAVGTDRPAIGHDIAFEAAEMAGFDLHVVGEGTESYDGISTTGHGRVPFTKLRELMSRSSLFVHPARCGAFPIAVLEAMRAGVPVIGSNRIGNRDLIDNRFVCDASSLSLRQRIHRYFSLPLSERRMMSENYKAKARSYSPKAGITRFKAVYSNI